MSFRLDIQGLRALAVIFVIIYHFNKKWLPGGFVGVDMFFVISGFLISQGILKQIEKKTFSYSFFLINRIRRIVPAYIFMLLFCAIVATLFFLPDDFDIFYYQLRRTFFFLSNTAFTGEGNYFGTKAFENLLLHTWSLSIEMQFYVLLPLVMLIIPFRYYKAFLLFLFLVSLIYTEYQMRILGNVSDMYISLLARSLEFMIGISLNFVHINSKNQKSPIISIVGLSVLIISVFFINENSIFPGVMSLPACLATGFLIISGKSTINQRILSNDFMVFLGKISYSLYLWHWPILAIYRYYYVARYELSWIDLIIIGVTVFIASTMSFYLIEETCRKQRHKYLYYTLGIPMVLLLFIWSQGKSYISQNYDVPYEYVSDKGQDYRAHYVLKPEYVLLGDTTIPNSDILLIGDSHGHSYTAFFDYIGKRNRFNFSFLTSIHIPPILGLEKTLSNDKTRAMIDEVDSRLKDVSVVLLAFHWSPKIEGIEQALDSLVSKLQFDQKLVIVSDFPYMENNPVRFFRSLTKPKYFPDYKVFYHEIPDYILSLSKKHANVFLLNIEENNFFKDGPYYRDTLTYYDESHMNKYGSIEYGKYKEKEVMIFFNEKLLIGSSTRETNDWE